MSSARLDCGVAERHDWFMTQTWSAAGYTHHAGFVSELGTPLLERLTPLVGERILDLGCGEGTLTARLVERGARVVGVDASREMVAAARLRGLEVRLADAAALAFDREFDAVFSNAVLHWIHDADAVLAGVSRALVPGGRFVAEFGGHGCIAAVATALRAVLDRRAIRYTWPWYYPSADEYAARLHAAGFVVEFISLFPRPTPLPTGMAGWLDTFGVALFSYAPAEQRASIRDEVVALLEPALCDKAGQWTADYVRLQVVARKPDRQT